MEFVVVVDGHCIIRRCGREALNVAVNVVSVVMAVVMAVSMAVSMVMFVEEGSADQVEGEADAPYYEHQLRVLNMLERNEALNGLQKDAQAQSEEEGAIEEGAEELRTCPTKGEVLWRFLPFRHLNSYQGNDEANEIIQLSFCKYIVNLRPLSDLHSEKHLLQEQLNGCKIQLRFLRRRNRTRCQSQP